MKKTASNFMFQVLNQFTLLLLPLLTIPIISRALGPEGVGVWNFMQSILSYFLLIAGLGIHFYGIREISIIRGDKKALSHKFWEIFTLNFSFAFLILCIYIAFSFMLEHTLLYLIQGLILVGAMLDISWFYSGMEEFKLITISNVVVKVIAFISIIQLINTETDLIWYVLIQSASVLIRQILLWGFLKKRVALVRYSLRMVLSHILPSLRFFISQVAIVIYLNLNKTILGILGTMTIVGLYSSALKMVTLSGSIVAALNIILMPKMSRLYSKGNENEFIDKLEGSLHFLLFLTIPMTFGIILTNAQMISWYFGDDFQYISRLVPWLAPSLIFQALQSGIAAQYLIPKNDMRAYNITVIQGAIVSIVGNLVLIPVIGVYGAVVTTVGTQMLLCIVRGRELVMKTTFKFQYKLILKYLFSAAVMLIVGLFVSRGMPHSPITTLIQIVVGIAVYFIMTTILRVNVVKDYLLLMLKRDRQKR